jgi:hypothetical protein
LSPMSSSPPWICWKPLTSDFNQPRVVGNPYWQEFVANPHCQQFVQFACAQNSKKIAASLNKTIFLIGLNTNINAAVKNTAPATFKEAYNNMVYSVLLFQSYIQ